MNSSLSQHRCIAILIACAATIAFAQSNLFAQGQRQELSVTGVRFSMIGLPAMRFPGGELGVTAVADRRPDMIGVDEDYWLAETNTTYELWAAVRGWALDHGYEFEKPGRMGTETEGMNDQHPVTLVD